MEKITDIIIATAILVGVWLFGCWMGVHHFRDEMETIQRDTVTVYDTMRYSRIELVRNTYTLKIPKVNAPNLAFLDVEKVDTIYKDNVMYLTYPRENYYTKANDVEIWHSGIDSTIDSLNVVQKTQNITESILQKPSPWRFSCDVGVDYGNMGTRFLAPNLGAELSYRKIGVRAECGAGVPFVNGQPALPQLYWKVGVKYRFVGR